MKIVLGIEYNGARFSGWQSQHGQRTIQQTVEQALSIVSDRPVKVICAGRTDAKVHALQQIIHFETDSIRSEDNWRLGGNSNLPSDVNILWVKKVKDDFHARYSSLQRNYLYIIWNQSARSSIMAGRMAWEYRQLDITRMQKAARHLIGEHDFTSYRAANCQAKNPVRRIDKITLKNKKDIIWIDIVANAFLYHMVRNIVGVLLEIGCSKQHPDWAKQVLDARDRKVAGITAPPEGLYLRTIKYPKQYGLPEDSSLTISLLNIALT